MITRRGLVGGLAAFLAAPAIVRAASLMPISVQPEYPDWLEDHIATPEDFGAVGDGVHDDTRAVQEMLNRCYLVRGQGRYRTTETILINRDNLVITDLHLIGDLKQGSVIKVSRLNRVMLQSCSVRGGPVGYEVI